MNHTPRLAYICMEFGLNPELKTYSGGLGILAGDTIKTYADMGIPAVGIGILYKQGYLSQELNNTQGQINHPQEWDYASLLTKTGHTQIPLQKEIVEIDIWEYQYTSPISNKSVSILFLDTDLPENSELFRQVSQTLYAAEKDVFHRQLITLGLGSWYALQTLNLTESIKTFHLNESHSALLALVLDQEKTQVTFTTHTPLKGGHARIPRTFMEEICTKSQCIAIPDSAIENDTEINLTALCLELADYSNAVSAKHREVTGHMFPGHTIDFITNGVHVPTWISPSMKKIFDQYLPNWQNNPHILRYAESIKLEMITQAHQENRANLHNLISKTCGERLLPDAFTIGFARRSTEYKRATLILSNPDQLLALAHEKGGLNLIFAGKAYHEDPIGKQIIKTILDLATQYNDSYLKIVYLPNYEIELAKSLVSGVDIWLNTPQVSHEASGTSGMKACLNGVPNISVNDGWWIEGGIDGVNGWTIQGFSEQAEIESMYRCLEDAMNLYHTNPHVWATRQRAAIALVGSYFNTHRMITEYMVKGYLNLG